MFHVCFEAFRACFRRVLRRSGRVSDVFRHVSDLRIGVPGSKFDVGPDFEVHLSSAPLKTS